MTAPGIYPALPMRDYLAMKACSATHLRRLRVSPLRYAHAIRHEAAETEATFLGTAVHAAVLESASFWERYAAESDELFADLGIALNASPRATKAYKDWRRAEELAGRRVLKPDVIATIEGMAHAVRSHELARKTLDKAPEREVTVVWRHGERLCRARPDALGQGVIVNLKTTRNLAGFSPWELTRYGYWRAAAFQRMGLAAHGREARFYVFIAVESEPPYDVGVFELEADALRAGELECEELLTLLDRCESEQRWPGQFEGVQRATITDQLAATMAGMLEDGVETVEEAAGYGS